MPKRLWRYLLAVPGLLGLWGALANIAPEQFQVHGTPLSNWLARPDAPWFLLSLAAVWVAVLFLVVMRKLDKVESASETLNAQIKQVRSYVDSQVRAIESQTTAQLAALDERTEAKIEATIQAAIMTPEMPPLKESEELYRDMVWTWNGHSAQGPLCR